MAHNNSSVAFTPSLSNLSDNFEQLLNSTIGTLLELELDTIDESWTNEVWDAQFTECHDLPEEFEIAHEESGRSVGQLLDKAANFAQKWLKFLKDEDLNASSLQKSHDDASTSLYSTNSSFWTALIQRGVKYKSLIALLFYYMEKGHKFDATPLLRSTCLKATSFYFILLGIPGSGAFKIFHPVLYNKALDTFKLALKLHLVKQSPKKKVKGSKQKGSSQSQSQGPRKRRLSRASSTCSGISDLVDWDDSDDDDGTLTPAEISELTVALNRVLYSCLTMLDHCPLKRSPESLELTIMELVELTHLETGFANLDFSIRLRRSDLSALAFNAYSGLEKLCSSIHGSISTTVSQIFRHLLPGILMTHRGSSDISPKGLAVIREHALHFVKHLIVRVGEDCFGGVEVLIQHLAMKVPERAEYRHRASLAIIVLLVGLPVHHYSRIIKWFFYLAHNEKSAHRQFAIEVMGRLLAENERKKPSDSAEGDHDYGGPQQQPPQPIVEAEENLENGEEDTTSNSSPKKEKTNTGLFSSHKFLFGVIFSRCKDVSALVRAKALQTLADVTATAAENPVVADVITNLFDQSASSTHVKRTVDFVELLQDPEADLALVNPLPESSAFIDFLRKRALDESVYVRKNALLVLENILKFYASQSQVLEPLALELVAILAEHCRDPSVMVRKQIVGSLTEILKAYPDNEIIVHKWVEGVFPLILDVEQKAAEKVHELIWEVLFGNIVSFEKASHNRHFLPWKILNATEKLKMTSYLSRACGQWAKAQLLKPSLLKTLKSHVDSDNGNAAWLLLALVTGHVPLQDPKYVMEFFNSSIHTPEGVGLYTLLQVLRVLLASVSQLDQDDRKSLQKDLLVLVKRFLVPPELISTAVDIATIVSSLEASGCKTKGAVKSMDGEINLKDYHAKLELWTVEIIESIDAELGQKILTPSASDVEDTRMMRQIFTLGELAQICPHKINKRLFLLMQGIIFQQGTRKRKPASALPSSQTQSNEPVQCAFTPTIRLQALSVITLAKMCLQNEEMAKCVVPAFGRLLDTTNDAALKNNIIYALSDMCVRYASLVDPLLPNMTACLKDPVLVVRRTTLTTLIHLLQEDYLKMTPGFFLRILQTLCDETDEIRDLTTFYIQQRLLKRKPKVFYHVFIEALFHFNHYQGHGNYNKGLVSEKERKLFSLAGKENKSARMKLYKFMLEHMTDEDRFQTTYKLCQDILNGCIEGSIKLSTPNAFELLQDTLACLASDEIKLASLKSKQDVDGDIDPNAETTAGDVAGAVLAAAKKTIISQVVKKNVIENIIPIVISLKHRLEKLKSPLLDDLMNYLREVMKDYKNEVKEILAADKQLATEIQFDLKKWEDEMEARRQREEDDRRKAAKSLEEAADEGPSRDPKDNQKVLRAVIESAVSAIAKKRQRLENDEDADQNPNSVIENLIELSLPRLKKSKRHADPDHESEPDKEEDEPASKENDDGMLKAVAALSPKIVLKRVNEESSKQRKGGKKAKRQDEAGEQKDADNNQIDEDKQVGEAPDENDESEDTLVAEQDETVIEKVPDEATDTEQDAELPSSEEIIEAVIQVESSDADQVSEKEPLGKPTDPGKAASPEQEVKGPESGVDDVQVPETEPEKGISSNQVVEEPENEVEDTLTAATASETEGGSAKEEPKKEIAPKKVARNTSKQKDTRKASKLLAVTEAEEILEEASASENDVEDVAVEMQKETAPKKPAAKPPKQTEKIKASKLLAVNEVERIQEEAAASENDVQSAEVEPDKEVAPEKAAPKTPKQTGKRKASKLQEVNNAEGIPAEAVSSENDVLSSEAEPQKEIAPKITAPKAAKQAGKRNASKLKAVSDPEDIRTGASENIAESAEVEPQKDIAPKKTAPKAHKQAGKRNASKLKAVSDTEDVPAGPSVKSAEVEPDQEIARKKTAPKTLGKRNAPKLQAINEAEDAQEEASDSADVEPQKEIALQKTPKQPGKRKASKLRAISTPVHGDVTSNITFMDRSEGNMSAIPVLSPPTVKKNRKGDKPKVVNEASFQFRTKRGRDAFEDLIGAPSSKKKAPPESPNTSTRSGRSLRKNPKYL